MQDSVELLSNSKWLMLKEIASKEQSATELAQTLHSSVSNVTQQLKLLEAYNIISRKKSSEKHIGKPRTIYCIKDSMVYAAMLKKGKAEKKLFKLEGFNGLLYNLVFTAGAEDSFYILKFILKHEDILKRCKALGFLRSNKESVELFILTEHVDDIRAQFSNLFIEDINGKTKKIVNWTHNDWEINDGLSRKDKYFLDKLSNVQTLYDPHGLLEKAIIKRKSM